MSSDQEIIYKLAFNFIPNVGAINAKNLISYCGGIDKVFSSNKSKLLKVPGIGQKKVIDILNSDALALAEKEYEKIENQNIKVSFYLDDDYPQRLRNFIDSPLIIYKKGKVNLDVERTVAIVGTRKPTSYGITQCEKITEALKDYNVTIVSGLAYGVDTIAHRKSVKQEIPTVGVLGNGISKIYPSANHQLAQKMTENGGIISEFPVDTKPDRENFPRRNRIISALSDVIIVIESAIKGGSMITALYANDQNKDVFALPGKINDSMSAGCNFLIKTNQAHLLHSVDDIAYIMRWDQPAEPKQMQLIIDLDEKEQNIVDLLKREELGVDSLMYQSGLRLSQVSSILLNLEFKGLVKSLPGKKYILT